MPQSSSHFSSTPSIQLTQMSVSSPLAAIPGFDNNGLDPTKASLTRLQQLVGLLDSTLRLPDSPRAFAVYLLGLAIVFAGAFMHVLVAAQIMQAEFTLSRLQEEYRSIEQQNGDIIFQIARDTNMARLHERVKAVGYVPVQKREYIFVPSENLAGITAPAQEAAETEQIALASESTGNSAPAAAAPINISSNLTSAFEGQMERWHEFWWTTWRATLGRTPQTTAVNLPSGTVSSQVTGKSSSNFWSVWWEQASEQGAKLLEQVRGQ